MKGVKHAMGGDKSEALNVSNWADFRPTHLDPSSLYRSANVTS